MMWKRIIAFLLFLSFSTFCFSQDLVITSEQILTIKTELAILKLQLNKSEKLREDLKLQIINLDRLLVDYEKQTKDLETQIINLETYISNLEGQISNLETQLKNYEKYTQDLEKVISDQEKTLKGLKKSLFLWKAAGIISTSIAVGASLYIGIKAVNK